MELSCASAVNALDQFVSAGIKPSASLPQVKRRTISESYVSLHARMEMTQTRVDQQVNLDSIMDCQRRELVFVQARHAIISKVRNFKIFLKKF
jgi:hypothetical protein